MDRRMLRAAATHIAIAALLAGLAPIPAVAEARPAHLAGVVVDAHGRPAPGAIVYLFDGEGVTRAEAVSTADGTYSVPGVAPGSYGMSVRTPQGIVAPVSTAPVRLGSGELVRRDLKLVEADAATVDRALALNPSFGSWFGGLTGAEKAGVIVGFIAVAALIYTAFEDDDEPAASPM